MTQKNSSDGRRLIQTWSSNWPAVTASTYGAAMGINGTKIHIAGGVSAKTTNYQYDILTNTWATKTAMAGGRQHAGSDYDSTRLWVLGGDSGSVQKTVWYYTFSTNAWNDGTVYGDMPFVRYRHLVRLVGTTFWVFGGSGTSTPVTDPNTYKKTVWSWVPGGSWTTSYNAMTTSVSYAKGFVDGNYVYVVGGYDYENSVMLSSVLRYNTTNDTWATMTSMPMAGLPSSLRKVGNYVYIFGIGTAVGSVTGVNVSLRYDIARDLWTVLPPAPDVAFMGGAVVDPSNSYMWVHRGYNTTDFWRVTI